MTPPFDPIKPLRFSSTDFPARDRLARVREVLAREIMRFEIEPRGDQPLQVDVTVRPLPGLSVAVSRFTASFNRHTSEMIDDDDPVLSIVTEGSCTWRQEGRSATLSAGQGLLTTRGAAGTLERHAVSRVINLRMKRKALQAHVPRFDEALIRPDLLDSAVLRLLAAYTGLLDERHPLGLEMGGAIALHLQDLVILVLGPGPDAAQLAESRGLRAARLNAIKMDIMAHLDRHDLGVDFLTQRHGLSERSIRALFQSENTTFTDYVRDQRLNRVHRLLRDPQYARQAISEIAFTCGFGDLSYFNRIFRRRFGETPSDVRAWSEPKK